MSGHNVRIHPHNENLESPRPRHLSSNNCVMCVGDVERVGGWGGGLKVYLGWLWEGYMYVLPRLHWDHIFYSK